MISTSVKLQGNLQRIKKASGRVSLYLLVIINRDKKTIPLDISWYPEYIDNKAGVILPTSKKDQDHSDYQIIINKEIGKVNEIFKIFRMGDRVLTMELFLKEYKTFENRKDFLVFMESEIERRYTERNIRFQTYKNHKATLGKLKDFKPTLFYYEVTAEFFSKFTGYLIRKVKNNQNTVWTAVKDLKCYLSLARKNGIVFSADYLNFPTGSCSNRIVYLEDDELKKLFSIYSENSLDPVQQQSLRAFLFQAMTSIRISDVYRANWAWMNTKNELTFIPYKNERFQKYVTIPVSETALSLIENQRGAFFNLPAEPTINEKLKIIAEKVGIRKNLTTHVARHTFGTLYHRSTKDLLTLSKIMGHAKIQQTMVYAHINDQDKREGVNKYEADFLRLVYVNPAPVGLPVPD